MDASSSTGKGSSRRVSFSSKCQIVPWNGVEEDPPIGQAYSDLINTEGEKKKRRSPLHVIRSLGSSSSSARYHRQLEEEQRNNKGGSNFQAKMTSQERRSRGVSPSLPINKNPAPASAAQVETLRKKLISPPPPIQSSPSASPIQHRLALASSKVGNDSNASNSPEPTDTPSPDISRPRAIRKPLSFGPFGDDDLDGLSARLEKVEMPATLRIPPVITAPASSPSEEAPARAVLQWKEEDEETEEGTSDDVFEEEELNGNCVCADCEQKMTAALSASYETPWTRPARKKYLADRKLAQLESMRKKSAVAPSWLREDNGEVEGSSTTAREIKADEVDAKKGTSNVEVVPSLVADPAHIIPANNIVTGQMKATDATLIDEVEQELKMRREEERLKKSRLEMNRLSNDFSSGLRTGGGGARAMMRQLEEAERMEKRASIQRTRSPTTMAEAQKEEARPMGAVKDTIVTPFTVPRRLSDGGPIPVLPRTPSPQLQQQQQQQQQQTTSKKTLSPSREEMTKAKDRDHRLPSPSLLIRRELALGIPIHTNYAAQKSSWPTHPPTRTPSPRLIHPTTLEVIAEVPSRTNTNQGESGTSTPKRAHTIGHVPNQLSNRRHSVPVQNGQMKIKRHNSLSGKQTSNLTNHQVGLNLSQHAQSGGGDTRGHSKTRILFQDLVARIKS